MSKKGNGGLGVLLGVAGLALGYSLLQQGQTAGSTLTTARLTGFELKSFSAGSLGAVARFEFSNTDVNRSTSLEALGMNVVLNDTVVGTAHLVNGQPLPANQDTTIDFPVSIKLTALLSQLALAGSVPNLATFTSLGAVRNWLGQVIGPEQLRMQGTAKVDGVTLRFDQPLYLLPPSQPQGPVQQLPSTRAQVRPQTQPGGAAPKSPNVQPRTVVQPRAVQVVNKATQAAPVVRQTAALVKKAGSLVKAAVKHRATGKPTAAKKKQPVKPPVQAATPKVKPGDFNPYSPTYDAANDPWNKWNQPATKGGGW